ncbi:MAG: homogentisate 1,2-dioxygenase, partial [Candidatus Dormibacteria bacterium]
MYPLSRGRTAYQAHVHVPEGVFEEEHGRDAFSGPCSHLYRLHPPTAWEEIEGPLKPRAFDLNGLAGRAAREWVEILGNEDCNVYVYSPQESEEVFLRDADGDITYFVHHGAGT